MADIFVMFSTNENGIFSQPNNVNLTLRDAMSNPPFAFEDVFVYSHGWWTKADDAMALYSRYIVEFNKNLLAIAPTLANPPQDSFGLGVHWPSTVSEDMNSLLEEVAQATSYYKMGARAQQVGSSGLYAALSLMIQSRVASPVVRPFRLTLLGHSFGCRVVCSALQRLANELSKPTAKASVINFVNNLEIRVVLLQAAFKNSELDPGGNYDAIHGAFPRLKVLITTSQLDYGLNHYFPMAENINNIANLHAPTAVALGAGVAPLLPISPIISQPGVSSQAPGGGPTLSTWHSFGAVGPVAYISIVPGFVPASVALPVGQRIAVADLTPVHMANLAPTMVPGGGLTGPPAWPWDGKGGSHSDISCPEIHNLISGFVFN